MPAKQGFSKRMGCLSLYYNQGMTEENTNLSEEVDLINAAKTDPEAFGQLYERYVERIYNYIYFKVGSVKDAEDLTAKVFFKALKSVGGYRHMGLPFSAWLYRIAHNLVANFHRDRSRIQEISIENLVLEDRSHSSAPENLMEAKQESAFLLRLVNDLSPQKRELVILKHVHRLSNEEIGKIFGKTEGAIKSLYHRTLVELKERAKNNDETRIL
ncbi:MAG: sigma-70 family RNA polymerase sigma factor [Anaerolineaceae bacterium]|jgi:RNA polymerase sigma-70 factor (ECF subfamily)|nr:sigma-70 family RNA polymerase sigma factor [Anaerolineaceae bacterium]